MKALLWRFVCVFAATLALASAVHAQPGRTRPQRVDPLTSSIQGRVTTSDTGASIRGAEVRLAMDGRFSRLVTTDGEGRFELRNLPAGEYRLTVSTVCESRSSMRATGMPDWMVWITVLTAPSSE